MRKYQEEAKPNLNVRICLILSRLGMFTGFIDAHTHICLEGSRGNEL